MARLLKITGFLVAAALCAVAFWKGGGELPDLPWQSPVLWSWLALSFGLYLLSQLVAGGAWALTLAAFPVRLSPIRAATQLLVSQIGKYVPGNVAHLLGRLVMARSDGVAGKLVGIALLVEICLVVSAGGLLLSALLLVSPDLVRPILPELGSATRERLATGVVVALVLCVALGSWAILRRIRRQAGSGAVVPRRFLAPLGLHLMNFLILGLSLACAMQAVAPSPVPGVLLPVSVFVAAWTIGFLTPGAPGGIGIREGLIVLGLGATMGDGAALATALLHRALAMSGDVAAFGIGLFLRGGSLGSAAESDIPP